MLRRPVSVTELPGYKRRADQLLSEDEQDALIDVIAYEPTCGVVIPGTGGLRKLRVAVGGSGKRGGARVIYYFYNEDFPVLLMTIFAKNERADLTERQKKASIRYAGEFVAQWQKK
ncbi:MAG TPA: type II toxin-antitoxin system RelE/ParE family toxin [Pseudolabrys sp.]|nr:type II toxin-antitoxin system RelE/ParE family toxin [Pseudolabrys sp.]